MVERVRSTKPRPCSTDAWADLVQFMNAKADIVLPTIAAVDEVVECHARCVESNPVLVAKGWLPSLRVPGRKYYSVSRTELFAFVQAHGKVCGHG